MFVFLRHSDYQTLFMILFFIIFYYFFSFPLILIRGGISFVSFKKILFLLYIQKYIKLFNHGAH